MAFELIENHYILEEEQKQADDSRTRLGVVATQQKIL